MEHPPASARPVREGARARRLGHPVEYYGVLRKALKAAPGGMRGHLWQLFYFAEAIALWDHAERSGARHLHAHLANVAADICWWASEFGNSVDPARPWRWSFTMHGPTECTQWSGSTSPAKWSKQISSYV